MDTTKEEESSKLMETTKTMEKSEEIEESGDENEESGDDNEESGDENEESGDDNEESGDKNEESGDDYVDPDDELLEATWWTVPEWDVDSFDGREYDSSEENNEFAKEDHEQKWRRFKRQLIENKGFYVEPELWPMYNYSDFKFVLDLDIPACYGQTYREYFEEMARLCLQKYNEYKGLNVEFVEVVRGIFTASSRSKSYITFMAMEKPDGQLRFGVLLLKERTTPSSVDRLLCQSLQTKTSNGMVLDLAFPLLWISSMA